MIHQILLFDFDPSNFDRGGQQIRHHAAGRAPRADGGSRSAAPELTRAFSCIVAAAPPRERMRERVGTSADDFCNPRDPG